MVDKEKTGRERLEKALSMFESEIKEEFPPETEDVFWSRQHEREMEKLIKQSNHTAWKKLSWIGKSVAIIAIAFLIMMSKDIFTYGESKFTSEFYSYSYEYRPDIVFYGFPKEDKANAPQSLETLFEVTYIPDGYELIEHSLEPIFAANNYYRYENEDGDYISFQQNRLSHSVGFTVPQWTLEEVKYQDITILYAEHEKKTTIYWGNYGYSFSLSFSDPLPREECMKIFESVKKVKD